MIGMCSPDSQHGDSSVILRLYMNKDLSNQTNQRRQQRICTREENQLVFHCYFRSNSTQRGYRKRMIDIWKECVMFQTTSQRLVDQVSTIIKKGWFSDLELLEIRQKTNSQSKLNKNTLTEMN